MKTRALFVALACILFPALIMAQTAPTVTTFTPTVLAPGLPVVITGTNFTGVTNVTFAGVAAATFTVDSATQIKATAPTGVASGVIAIVAAGGTATSSAYTVTTLPIITGFSPASGPVGRIVRITGANFQGFDPQVVTFNGVVSGYPKTWFNNYIELAVPVGAATGPIVVTTSQGTVPSATHFVVATGTAPTNDNFAAAQVLTGTSGSVTGSNTNATSEPNEPSHGGNAAGTSVWFAWTAPSTGKIHFYTTGGNFGANLGVYTGPAVGSLATVASGNAGYPYPSYKSAVSFNAASGTTYFIALDGYSGMNGEFTLAWAPIAAPTVTGFSPGSVYAGQYFTINGTGFLPGATVVIGGATVSAGDVDVISPTYLTVQRVPFSVATGVVTVTTANGYGSSSGNVTITTAPTPTITSFSPTVGEVGTWVGIYGTALALGDAPPVVKFNGTIVTSIISEYATAIYLHVPAGATSGRITVQTSKGTATSSTDFTVNLPPAPTITAFTPTTLGGGMSIVITGTNFTGASSLTFNGVAAWPFTVNSATQITATVPTGVTSGAIAVMTPGGTATSATNYTATTLPIITSFSPVSGPVKRMVRITGANFQGFEPLAVTFNGVASSNALSYGDGFIELAVPVGAVTGPIVVTTSQSSATSATNFTVAPGTAPANDTFAAAQSLTGSSGTITGSNTNATKETNEPNHGGNAGGASIWFAWTAPSAGKFVFYASSGNFGANFGVYTGAAVGALTTVASGNAGQPYRTYTSAVSFNATAGATYSIALDGYDGYTGDFTLAWAPISTPTVTGVSPTSVYAGQAVGITGTGFLPGATVVIGGATVPAGNVFASSPTALWVNKVPYAAVTGVVTVTTANSSGSSPGNLTITTAPPPTITSFNPTVGEVGTWVGIFGTALALGDASPVVKFNGTTVPFISSEYSASLYVHVPAGATSGRITVQTSKGTATSSTDFTVNLPPAPTITSFTPTMLGGGLSVVITGTNFTGASSVTFNGVAAGRFTINSATQITAAAPVGVTSGAIAITTSGGTATSAGNYTVTSLPIITSVTPMIGTVGRIVGITGANFTNFGAPAVAFNGVSSFFALSGTYDYLQVSVPAGATTGRIVVTTSQGSATSATDFVIAAGVAPTNDNFAAAQVLTGAAGTLTGSNANATKESGEPNHGGNAGGASIWFAWTAPSTGKAFFYSSTGNFGANLGVYTGTTVGGLTTVASGNAAQPYPTYASAVSFEATSGITYFVALDGYNGLNGDFTLTWAPIAAPTVTSFSPGSVYAGQSLYVSGTGFLPGATVVIGGATVPGGNVNVRSPTSLSVSKVPFASVTGVIAVTTVNGSGGSSGNLTVTAPPAPTITSFTPTAGVAGTWVNIQGTALTLGDAPPIVKFNGTPGTTSLSEYSTSYSIYTFVPAGATSGPITVETSAGTGTSSTNFTVNLPPAPTITSFTPATIGSGLPVVITGTNFTGATGVAFNGVAAGSFAINSATQITATAPTGVTSGTIAVTTPGGTATSATNYTATTLPIITSFSPASGPVGRVVTILGVNFGSIDSLGNPQVLFNGVAAQGQRQSVAGGFRVVVPSGATDGPITVTVVGGGTTATSNFTVAATATAPANDDFANAQSISGETGVIAGSNVFATKQGGEPNHGTAGGHSVWFKWTAPANGSFIFDQAGSEFGAYLGVYTGTDVNALTSVAVGNPLGNYFLFNYGPAAFNAQSGVTYYIALEGFGGSSGALHLAWSRLAAPTITSFSPTSGYAGQQVDIYGSGFTKETTVSVNGVLTDSYMGSAARMVIRYLPATSTTGPIVVTTVAGPATSASNLIVTAPPVPVISSFSPTSGAPGTRVTISGTAVFLGVEPAVRFNGVQATPGNVGIVSTSIYVDVPAGATSGPITVQTSAGTATSSANFTVNHPPAIVASPAHTTGIVGRPLTLTAQASGSAPLSYVWRFNATPIPAGPNSPMLTIPSFSSALAGAYDVLVSNSFASNIPSAVANVVAADPVSTWLADPSFTRPQFRRTTLPIRVTRSPIDSKLYVTFSPLDALTGLNNQRVGAVIRLTPTGSIDPAFTPGTGLTKAWAVACQSNGQILVGGIDPTESNDTGGAICRVFRLNADGSRDATYRSPTFFGLPRFMTLQSDGKLLVSAGPPPSITISGISTVARLNTDGSLDPSFAQPVFDASGAGYIFAPIVVDSSDRVLIAGTFTTVNGVARSNLARLNSNGSLDTTFVPSGFTTTGTGSQIRGLAIQGLSGNAGKILVAGGTLTVSGSNRPVIRLNPADGSLDSSFTLTTQAAVGMSPRPRMLVLNPANDSFTVVGAAVARFNADGSTDTGFNRPAFSPEAYWIEGLADGSVIVPADFGYTVNGTAAVGLLHFTNTGALDATYNISGFQTEIYGDNAFVQPDSRALMFGDFDTVNTTARLGLARFGVNGGLDSLALSGLANLVGVEGGHVRTDGTFLAKVFTGTSRTSATSSLRVFNADGSLNATGFSLDATVQSVFSNENPSAEQLADNRMLVGINSAQRVVNGSVYFVRVNANGTLDGTFTGLGATNYGAVYRNGSNVITQLVVGEFKILAHYSDGRSLVAVTTAHTQNATALPVTVIRLNANGTPDGTFVAPSVSAPARSAASSVAINDPVTSTAVQPPLLQLDHSPLFGAVILPDNRILLGGDFAALGGTNTTQLARLNANGGIDATFSTGSGPAFRYQTGSRARISSVTPAPDGKYWVTGAFDTFNGFAAPGIVRLTSSGSVDPTFATDVGYRPFLSEDSRVMFAADGSAYLAGSYAKSGDLMPFTLTRLIVPAAATVGAPLALSSSVVANGSITLGVSATGSPAPTYRWQFNGLDIQGATSSSYGISNATQANAGTYTVFVSNSYLTTPITSSTTLAVIERSLLNLLSRVTVPARGSVGSSFTIEGGPKNILIRAVGPSLSGVTGALADPRLTLLNWAFVSIATNDDWGTPQTIAGGPAPATASEISAAMASVTPAPGFSSGSKDAALYVNLAPGTYTAVLDGAGGAGGVTQLEIVDAGTGNWPRVALLTMRGFVSDTHHLIVGFNLTGPASRQYLMRVLGPSLGRSVGIHIDPVIDLYSGSTTQTTSLYYNDDWRNQYNGVSSSAIQDVVTSLGGQPYSFIGSPYDATIFMPLAPGTYTVDIAPYDPEDQTGEVLFELFNVDGERPAGIAPAITYLVKDQAVASGQTAILGVVALAKPAATFQWRKYVNGVPTLISDGTSAILQIYDVGAAQAGSYDVVISNTVNGVVNTITSPVRTLSLLPEFHSADTNRDHQISVGEVTRVIQLYNSRVGATRTGEYHVQPGTEDGFAPGPGALTSYHSADYNRDGRIDADELLRVIELFNSRSGTVRTGAYRVEAGTEDGFAPVSTG